MEAQIITLPELIALAKSEDMCVIEFFTITCKYCIAFQNILDQIAGSFKDVKLYKMDITDYHEVSAALMLEGVPSILVLNGATGQKYQFVPEPREPNEKTWYTREHVKYHLSKYTKGLKSKNE